MTDDLDLDETRRQLKAMLAAIDAGEVDAEPGQRAYLEGAADALGVLELPPPLDGDDDRLPVPVELTAEVLNAVVAKVTEALVLLQTGDQVLAAGMGGAAGGTAKSLLVGGQRLWARRRARIDEAAGAATEVSGLEPPQLLARALGFDDERRVDLLLDAFQTASREADRRKVRAYGRIAADGVMSDLGADVVRARRVFEALAALDDADLSVLLHMGRRVDQPWLVRPRSEDEIKNWPVLTVEMPDLADLLEPVLSRLTGLGLVADHLPDGSSFYAESRSVTPFARMCIVELMRGDDAGTAR